MAIKNPIVSEIAKGTFCINEFGMDAMFLVVGERSALLIDTGTGVFDIPAAVGRITDKPFEVALTHGHPDHAGGAGYFDKVYIHPADIDMASGLTVETRIGYTEMLMSMSGGIYDINADSVVRFEKLPRFLPLREGYIFDLGGRTVSVYETPGHTEGGLSFIDDRERIIFTGDACNGNTLLGRIGGKGSAAVETLLKTAKKIKSLSSKYDRNYNGHIGYAGMISCLPQRDSITDDMIELCGKVMSGELKGKLRESGFGSGGYVAQLGAAGMCYDPEKIYEDR